MTPTGKLAPPTPPTIPQPNSFANHPPQPPLPHHFSWRRLLWQLTVCRQKLKKKKLKCQRERSAKQRELKAQTSMTQQTHPRRRKRVGPKRERQFFAPSQRLTFHSSHSLLNSGRGKFRQQGEFEKKKPGRNTNTKSKIIKIIQKKSMNNKKGK